MDEPIILLQKYLPRIHTILAPFPKKVSEISKKYHERLQGVKIAIKTTKVFSSEKIIYDLWWEATEGNQASLAFLQFIDSTVTEILAKVDNDSKKQIIKLCYKMIVNFNDTQSECLNCIAELAVINKLLNDQGIKLIQIEKELANGKRFDFEITKNGKGTLVEVYNINFDYERIENSDKFKSFLETRVTNKLNTKLQGLPEQFPSVLLVPVLWGNIRGLDHFSEAFTFFEDFNFVSQFMMVAEYKNVEGHYLYDFGTVENFLKRAKEGNTH